MRGEEESQRAGNNAALQFCVGGWDHTLHLKGDGNVMLTEANHFLFQKFMNVIVMIGHLAHHFYCTCSLFTYFKVLEGK